MLLEGKTSKIIKELEEEMKQASEKLDFEKAANLRDRISAIERISAKQKVSNISENNIDVIGIYKNELSVCIEIFFVRGSKMIDREHYFYDDLKDMEQKEIISGFIKQYYIGKLELPNKIMIQEEIEDKELLEEWLSNSAKRKVEIKAPQKGEKLRFVEMAENNAKITLENKSKDKFEILNELKEILNLEKLPHKIETFDISNISGTHIVAGMCVAIDGVIKRNMTRRFRIKTVFGQDDPRCTEEVVTRRIKHSIENPKGGFGTLPDLILADGGITQIKAIKKALKVYELDKIIPVYGMVKDDKHEVAVLRFVGSKGVEPLEVKAGFSFVSAENAQMNLKAEMLNKSFAQVAEEADAAWDALLSKIQVAGGTEREKRLFYSTFFHAFKWPALRSDVNHEYTDVRGEVVNNGFHYYTDPSFWDDYRNKLVLLGIISPEVTCDVIKSITDKGEKRDGYMPTFFHGDHASTFISGSWLRGLRDFNLERAYKLILKNATVPGKGGRRYLDEYMERGWIAEKDTVNVPRGMSTREQ